MALAAVLTDALDDPGAAALDGYEALRRPVARDVLTTTGRLTRAATVRNQVARAARNLGFRPPDGSRWSSAGSR